MRKLVLLSFVIVASLQFCGAQSLDKMQWFNEPEQWEIKDKSLSMQVTPQSDYWRISHYGFTVDDAPFYYATYGGEFEVKVKITGDYKQRFDQAGLMLRINHENYIKAGIEFVDGKYNLSAVVTHKTSDWSVITLDKAIPYVWIGWLRIIMNRRFICFRMENGDLYIWAIIILTFCKLKCRRVAYSGRRYTLLLKTGKNNSNYLFP